MALLNRKEAVLHASAARTATGNGALEVTTDNFQQGSFFLDVSAASGTSPTLDVKLQSYDAASATWFDLGSAFGQKTAASKERLAVTAQLGARLRIVYTIGGTTPSFTFTVGCVLEG